jgi:hypothetical protein
MTCRHLSVDVWGGVFTRPFQKFRGDFFDDDKVVLDVALCADCVSRLSVSSSVALNSQTLELVDPVPVCPECWRKSRTPVNGV